MAAFRNGRAVALRAVVAAALALSAAAGGTAPARAGEALVAVAANFADVMAGIVPAFEAGTGHRLTVTTGSTGKLYAQIRNGAPFHAFLAADRERPELLEKEGGAVAGTRFTYAIGRLTLWSADPDLIGAGEADVLASPAVRHIAIASPDLAPYGLAAREALQSLGLWQAVSGKIVMGENIGQAFSMVATGNAEAGLVALAAVLSPGNTVAGSRWDVPDNAYSPIRQDAVLLAAGRDNAAAIALLDYLKTPAARAVIERYGYRVE